MKKWFREKWRRYRLLRLRKRQLLAMDERTRKDLAVSKVDVERLVGLYGPVNHNEHEWREK